MSGKGVEKRAGGMWERGGEEWKKCVGTRGRGRGVEEWEGGCVCEGGENEGMWR